MTKIAVIVAACCLFPLAMHALDQGFYISFGTRVLIYAMAAASLNLVLGYGGMVSFGHAAFFGAGAYASAMASTYNGRPRAPELAWDGERFSFVTDLLWAAPLALHDQASTRCRHTPPGAEQDRIYPAWRHDAWGIEWIGHGEGWHCVYYDQGGREAARLGLSFPLLRPPFWPSRSSRS
jgi:hypothetical protein